MYVCVSKGENCREIDFVCVCLRERDRNGQRRRRTVRTLRGKRPGRWFEGMSVSSACRGPVSTPGSL